MEKKKDKKNGFNPSAYATEYIKNHYTRKEVKFLKEEAEQLNAVLNDKKETFTEYVKENIKRDFKRLKKDAKK